MTRAWIAAAVGLLFMAACGSSGAAGSGGGSTTSTLPANDPACPDTPPVDLSNATPCPVADLICHYQSGPCAFDYVCKEEVAPNRAWQYGNAMCSPMAVPGYSAQNGDVCAFVGDSYVGGGNCETTATCEPDHTWSVTTSLGPDGYPCP